MSLRSCHRFVLLAALAGVPLSCAKDSVTDIPLEIAALILTGGRPSIMVGEVMQLSATPRSASGRDLTARAVEWSSNDSGVAPVSGTGLVTAVSAGTATITARAGGITQTHDVLVVARPRIGLSLSSIQLNGVQALTTPAPVQVGIANIGGGTLSGLTAQVSSSNASSALQVTLSSTTAPATLTVTPSIQGLAAGTYSATITVSAPDADNAPQISVQLVIAPSYELKINGAGSGTGTVTGPSLNCTVASGSTCTQRYAAGTTVTLTAAPTGGSQFQGWSGGCTVNGNSCTATMTADRNVTATFGPPQFALTVTGAGTGTGTVLSNPAGIACTITAGSAGGTCQRAFDQGTTVQLTPTAATGSTFAGWTGCTSVSGQVCTVVMSAARAVTARFDTQTLAILTINGGGTGSGTVTGGAGSGINCVITNGVAGSGCSVTLPTGTTVVLTATAASGGHAFTGWSGACTGTGTCTVQLSTGRTVVATFSAPSFTVRIDPDPHQMHVGWNWFYNATVRQADGTVIPGAAVTWSSSNTAVATVDAAGRVSAHAAGTTQIRATHSGVTGAAALTVVTEPCAATTIYPPTARVTAGLGASSCQLSGNPSHYFAFSFAQPFSMLLSLTSTEFRMASYWYTAQALAPARGLGGLISAATVTQHENLAILPAGEYVVEVRSADGRSGSYTADFAWGGRNPDVTNCQYAFVLTPVDYMGSLTATDCAPRTGSPLSNHDRFVVNLRANEAITVTLASASFDAYLELRDGGLNLVAGDNNSGGGTNARLTFTAGAQGGLYVIEVTGTGAGATGAYRLTVDSTMPGPAASPLYGPAPEREPALPAVNGGRSGFRLRAWRVTGWIGGMHR